MSPLHTEVYVQGMIVLSLGRRVSVPFYPNLYLFHPSSHMAECMPHEMMYHIMELALLDALHTFAASSNTLEIS